MKVKDVMTKNNLVTVKASSLVSEAWNKMKETGIHQVPVVLGNKYTGMLSYRELLRRRSIRPSSKVEAFMVKTPKVDENEKFETAIDLLPLARHRYPEPIESLPGRTHGDRAELHDGSHCRDISVSPGLCQRMNDSPVTSLQISKVYRW